MLKLTTLVGIAGWVLMTASAPLYATGTPIDVSLGDVSINKVPFLIAADAGIYAKNGLEVHQYITPTAAAAARESGVIVPPEYQCQYRRSTDCGRWRFAHYLSLYQ